MTGAHSVPEILSILMSQAGKFLGTSRMNRVVSKVLPPRLEIISPSPRTPLDAPNESWEAKATEGSLETHSIGKLNHTDLNNAWIKKGMKRESTKYFELKENETLRPADILGNWQADSRIHVERSVKTKTRWNHTIVTFNHAAKRGNSWAWSKGVAWWDLNI